MTDVTDEITTSSPEAKQELRRPASGSGLSLLIPSWHAALSDPGESDTVMFQSFDADVAFAV